MGSFSGGFQGGMLSPIVDLLEWPSMGIAVTFISHTSSSLEKLQHIYSSIWRFSYCMKKELYTDYDVARTIFSRSPMLELDIATGCLSHAIIDSKLMNVRSFGFHIGNTGILVFWYQFSHSRSQETTCEGFKRDWDGQKRRFVANKFLCLGNVRR